MASDSAAAPEISNVSAPPPTEEKVEEKTEKLQLAKQENTDCGPKVEVEAVKMASAAELSKPQDQQEDNQIEPPTAPEVESVPEAATKEVEGQPEEQVKVEVVEEKAEKVAQESEQVAAEERKEALEDDAEEGNVTEAVEASKEVCIEDEKAKEEVVEAIVEPEETPEADIVEEVVEKKPEMACQDEIPTEECQAPVLVDEPKETVEENEVEEEPKGDEEVTKPRESLGALMKKEVTEEKPDESCNKVDDVNDKEVQVCVSEAAVADDGAKETKEVEEVKEAEDNLGRSAEIDEELKKDDATDGSIEEKEEAEEVSEKLGEVECVSKDVDLASESKPEEATQEMEEKNGEEETKEESKDSETKEEENPSEQIEERGVEQEIKDGQDQAKEEAAAKPASKQSSNIMSKVKHTLVKAKKAIIGKSPSSKTISTDDIKVK